MLDFLFLIFVLCLIFGGSRRRRIRRRPPMMDDPFGMPRGGWYGSFRTPRRPMGGGFGMPHRGGGFGGFGGMGGFGGSFGRSGGSRGSSTGRRF